MIKRIIMWVFAICNQKGESWTQRADSDHRFSWEAQLPPAICAMAMLVVFVSKPDSRLNFFFMWVLHRVHM